MSLCIEEEIMKINKWLTLVLILSVIGTLVIYPLLPSVVPIHWNYRGEVDGTGPKWMALLLAILPIALYVLMFITPKIDPKGVAYSKFTKGYQRIIEVTLLLLVVVHWLTLAWALGIEMPIDQIVKIGLSLLFIVMGNYLGQIRPNYTFGIRTPWTLANEQVWIKTHRMSSYAYVLSGILMLSFSFVKGTLGVILYFVPLVITLIFSLGISFVLYKRTQS